LQKSAVAFAGFSAGTADDLPGAFFQRYWQIKSRFLKTIHDFYLLGPDVLRFYQ
jgi:hypothetical protein